MKLVKTYIFYFCSLEICRNHDHDGRIDDGNDVGMLTKIPWKSDPYQNVNQVNDSGEDENACWEECTGKEGADADYCEGERRV